MYGIGGLVFLLTLSSSLAQNFTHSQVVAAMDKVFEAVDTNNNTFVEYTELQAAWGRIDANGDERVSEAEYKHYGTDHGYRGIVFQEMDTDGDGYVGYSAIMGEYEVMDTNRDNTVSRSEFDTYYAALVESAILHYGHLLG